MSVTRTTSFFDYVFAHIRGLTRYLLFTSLSACTLVTTKPAQPSPGAPTVANSTPASIDGQASQGEIVEAPSPESCNGRPVVENGSLHHRFSNEEEFHAFVFYWTSKNRKMLRDGWPEVLKVSAPTPTLPVSWDRCPQAEKIIQAAQELNRAGRHEEVLKITEELTHSWPRHLQCVSVRVSALMSLQRKVEAQVEIGRVLDFAEIADKTTAVAFYRIRAKIKDGEGKTSEAKALMHEAAALNSTDTGSGGTPARQVSAIPTSHRRAKKKHVHWNSTPSTPVE